jgi:hypothetical protein
MLPCYSSIATHAVGYLQNSIGKKYSNSCYSELMQTIINSFLKKAQ